jgi:hypothetical protein
LEPNVLRIAHKITALGRHVWPALEALIDEYLRRASLDPSQFND